MTTDMSYNYRTSIRQRAAAEHFHIVADVVNFTYVMTRRWEVKWRVDEDVVIDSWTVTGGSVCMFTQSLKHVRTALYEMYDKSTVTSIDRIDDFTRDRLKNWMVSVYNATDFVARRLQR